MAKPIKRHTWSNIDAFGLLNGLTTWNDQFTSLRYVRKPFDNSLSLKDRIYRCHDYPADVDKQGLLNAISNEFSLTPYNVKSKTIFELTNSPIPSGDINTQDISGYYKSGSSWVSLGPQVWSNEYNAASSGFIVWELSRFSNVSGVKNFGYSNIAEVITELPDETEVKFEYYVRHKDSDNNVELVRFTDMNVYTDSNDDRFTYRAPKTSGFDLSNEVVVYTLDDIPTEINSGYYYNTDGSAKDFVYQLKNYINKKYRHTWGSMKDGSCVWDIQSNYGSGHIPSFYDAEAPNNTTINDIVYSGYVGGIEQLSYSLYPETIVNNSGNWYLKIYPGKFYINGIPFYCFESPIKEVLVTSLVTSGEYSGLYSVTIPSELSRGAYTILAVSGYFDKYQSNPPSQYLSGIYEDYKYPTGSGNELAKSSLIYRRRPHLTSSKGLDITLNSQEYYIDHDNSILYLNNVGGSSLLNHEIIYETSLVPTGHYLNYELNPLNSTGTYLDKFFLYLGI